MLKGIDPIIIFQFSKLAPSLGETVAKIPIVSKYPSLIAMPPIPIYLSQRLTGLQIDNEEKNVDIQTTTETMTDGSQPQVDQKGLGSVVSINIQARKDSIGLPLLTAMMDQVFSKVTSKEYAISYLHGPIIIFGGLLHGYSAVQEAGTELMNIKIELARGGDSQPTKADPIPKVPALPGAIPI